MITAVFYGFWVLLVTGAAVWLLALVLTAGLLLRAVGRGLRATVRLLTGGRRRSAPAVGPATPAALSKD